MPNFTFNGLVLFAEQILSRSGLPRDESELVAKMLVKADLNGYSGHGISHILSYVDRIKTGTIQLGTRPEVVREGKATALMDGHFYFGQVVAYEGTKLALQKAREHGTGTVCIRHSGHIGRLADFMELIAESGMIGIAALNVGGRSIASYGAMESFGGTNPMGFGIPRRGGEHIILDFATAASSMGELRKKVRRGEAIPPGVMLDGKGYPTTDFEKFNGTPRGVVLPFGGYKGSGLHLMAEILGGILTGNGLGKEWWEKGGSAINGLIIEAICVEEFLPLDEFFNKLEELVAWMKSKKPAPGFDEITLPGENSRKRAVKNFAQGIEIDDKAWKDLRQCGAELGVRDLPKPF